MDKHMKVKALNTKALSTKVWVLGVVLLSTALAHSAHADTLERLKEDVKAGTKRNGAKGDYALKHDPRYNQHSSFGDFLVDGLFRVGAYVMYDATRNSFTRSMPSQRANADSIQTNKPNYINIGDAYYLKPRQFGDAALPILQAEIVAHNPWGDTLDANYSVLAGFGGLAVKYKNHSYFESNPADHLSMQQLHFLLRMSFGHSLEIHQGLGTTTYSDANGFEVDELSYTSPVIYNFDQGYQIEFTPTWSQTTTEYDLSLNKAQQYYSLKLGYRNLSSQNVDLSGMYVGIAVHF
jgi:hypothetical protein